MSNNGNIRITKEITSSDETRECGFVLDSKDNFYVKFPATTGYKIPKDTKIIGFSLLLKLQESVEHKLSLELGKNNIVTTRIIVFHSKYKSFVEEFMKQIDEWVVELIEKGVWQLIQDIDNPESVDKIRKIYHK